MNALETAMRRKADPSIDHLCALAKVSRAGFYRFGEFRQPERSEADLHDKIQTVALKNRFYGYRRIGQELWRRHGLQINHKRLRRLMREDNLLCLRSQTLRPLHDELPPRVSHRAQPHARALSHRPRSDLGRRHHLRASGRAIRLSGRGSRRLLAQGRRLGARRPSRSEPGDRSARHGLAASNPPPGLIHHSDRGVQYACAAYAERLEARGLRVSMSRAGNPYDNAKAERFMRTLKDEEVNGKTYASLEDARRRIGAFLETVYNRGRLHSALGYKPPVEFENELRQLQNV